MRSSARNALAGLQRSLGEGCVSLDADVRRTYGRDETEDLAFLPDAVVRPHSVEEVARVLQFAARERIPVTPRGAGTGLSGGALPVRQGLVLSVERLNRIRRIDPLNLLVEAEAGVVTGELQSELEAQGLFYPPDPASHDRCMLGGNLAEDSAGPRSCKYGSTRRWVLGLEAVLADGRLLRTGGDNRKDAAGYDLTQLLVGSEGTLAVITAATLRLLARPAVRLTLALPFADLAAAAQAVTEIFSRGHDPAACEIMDRGALLAVSELEPLPRSFLDLNALLMLELDGHDEALLLESAAAISDDLSSAVSGETVLATGSNDQRRMWRIRDRVGEAVKHGCLYKEADTVVPRAALAEVVGAAREVAAGHGLEAVCYGHAGDGNLHVNLLRRDLTLDDWVQRRDAAERELFERVVALGGSITGEHGVGWTQRQFLPLVRSESFIEAMRGIKTAFDPFGILNPGKIFPEPSAPDADDSRSIPVDSNTTC